MSTKIYNGLRFYETDIVQLFEHIQDLRLKIHDLAIEADCRWVARACVSMIDDAFVHPDLTIETRDRSPLSTVNDELRTRQEKLRATFPQSDPGVDNEFTIVAYPFEGRVYGTLYTQRSEFQEVFDATGLAEPWGYWDNTDAPDEVSAEEWDERGRVWDAIFARHPEGRPLACGFTFEFPQPIHMVFADEVLARLPSIEERAQRVAANTTHAREFKRLHDGDKDKALALSISVARSMRSDEMRSAVAAEKDRLKAILPEITRDILVGR